LVVGDWAVLLGDAAHSPVPDTGEGINSSLEDCAILQDCLASCDSLAASLKAYEDRRLEDAHALSALAYGAVHGGFKDTFQMSVLSLMSKFGLVGPCKEDYLFGKHAADVKRYSEMVQIWKKQTAFLFGPTLPPY
jgi:kynurenine 3-monooxygenase